MKFEQVPMCVAKGVAEKEGAIFMILFSTGSQEWSANLVQTHSLFRQDLPFIKSFYSFLTLFSEINANTLVILMVSEHQL